MMRNDRSPGSISPCSISPPSPTGGEGETRSLYRRVHEVAHQRARVLALARALHHEHRKQVFRRVDPEEGAGHAAPEILADRAGEGSHALMRANRKAEPEAVAGRQH